jgi:hypothetical protein
VFLTVADKEEHEHEDDDDEKVPCYKKPIIGKCICGVVLCLLILLGIGLALRSGGTAEDEFELPTTVADWRGVAPNLFEAPGLFVCLFGRRS